MAFNAAVFLVCELVKTWRVNSKKLGFSYIFIYLLIYVLSLFFSRVCDLEVKLMPNCQIVKLTAVEYTVLFVAETRCCKFIFKPYLAQGSVAIGYVDKKPHAGQ